MPRYFSSATPVSKPVHTKVYSLSLQSLSADASKIEGSVALGAAVNLKQIKPLSIVYPAEAPHSRIMDQKGYLFDAAAYVTIPYNVTHSFAPAKAFSVVVWVKLDAAPMNPLALVSHGTEWRLSLSATQEIILDVMDSAENYTT